MRNILFYLLLFYFLKPSLLLTIAVLTGTKLNSTTGKLDQLTSSSAARHVHLETRCQMHTYPNGKIFNCTSKPPMKLAKSLQLPIPMEQEVHCGENSQKFGETCVCAPGYKKFPLTEVCTKEEGQPCELGKKECGKDTTYMVCINNICSCESSDSYDPISMTCRGKVGGLCYPGIKECIRNANCVDVPQQEGQERNFMGRSGSSLESFYFHHSENKYSDHLLRSATSTDYVISHNNDIELSGRCECKEGYVESVDGLCKRGFGETCTSADQCDSLNLVCRDSICSCSSSVHVYDYTSKTCVALVGAQCSDDIGIGKMFCVRHAFCKMTNLRSVGVGKCACEENALETRMRTCVKQTKRESEATPSATSTFSHPTTLLIPDKRKEESSRVLFSDYD